MRIVIVFLVGVFMGYIFPQFFFHGSVLNIIPWGLVALICGIASRTKKEGLLLGAIYGFMMSFSFMVKGYSGIAPLVTRIPFFAILGIFGALCAGLLGFFGNLIGRLLKRKISS